MSPIDTRTATPSPSTPAGARRRHPALRWAAPIAAIAVVAAGSFGINTMADADPGLPDTTADQLVAEALTATVPGLSGTVSSTVQLGLPDLSGLGGGERGGGDSGPAITDWLTGTHTARVWQAGEDRQRVSVPEGDDEYGVYRTGRTTWLWSSSKREATKVEVTGTPARRAETTTPPTPQEAATRLLTEVRSTSTITLAKDTTVAGQPAYVLVVTPDQSGTTVGRVEIAVDGATKLPLRVEVFGTGASDPAISVGFSQLDYAVPADSVFAFTPPPGATVTTKTVDAAQEQAKAKAAAKARQKGGSTKTTTADHQVVGSGWLSVVVASGVTNGELAKNPAAQQVLATLPRVSGSWGSGVLFSGPLFSAVLTDDGRVAAGAVVPAQLYAALG